MCVCQVHVCACIVCSFMCVIIHTVDALLDCGHLDVTDHVHKLKQPPDVGAEGLCPGSSFRCRVECCGQGSVQTVDDVSS